MLSVVFGLALLSPAARAQAQSVNFSIAPVTDAGTRPVVSYRVRLAAGDRAELQTLVNGNWTDAAGLSAARHQITIASVTSGVHRYRIRVTNSRGRAVSTSAVKKLIAVPEPTVGWNLPTVGSADTTVPFNWTAGRVPAGAAVDVQEQQGTAHVWRTVSTLTGTSGAGSLPALSIGQNYAFRLAVIDEGSVLATQPSTINIFGQVPFSVLDTQAGQYSGTYTSASATFTYEFYFFANDSPLLTVAAKDNDCLSVQADFVLGSGSSDNNFATDSATVSVVQESANPVSSSVSFNQQSSVTANIVPGQSWSLVVQHPSTYLDTVYVNGFAVCDSTSPILPTS